MLEGHADRHVVQGQLESRHVLDSRIVRLRVVTVLEEHFHAIGILLGLFGNPLGDRCGSTVAVVVFQLLIVFVEYQVTDGSIHDTGRDGERDRVGRQVHVVMERVRTFHLVLEIVDLLFLFQRLILRPGSLVLPCVMTAVVDWENGFIK